MHQSEKWLLYWALKEYDPETKIKDILEPLEEELKEAGIIK